MIKSCIQFSVGTPLTIIAINSRKESDFAVAGAFALLLFERLYRQATSGGSSNVNNLTIRPAVFGSIVHQAGTGYQTNTADTYAVEPQNYN